MGNFYGTMLSFANLCMPASLGQASNTACSPLCSSRNLRRDVNCSPKENMKEKLLHKNYHSFALFVFTEP